jgi:hypothetical protein
MNHPTNSKPFLRLLSMLVTAALISLPWLPAQAVTQEAQISVKAVEGAVEYAAKPGSQWLPLQPGATLESGAVIRTASDGAADLFFAWSGTVLRLIPGTELRVDRLTSSPTEIENITDTRLFLVKGSVVGSQRKLPKASSFAIVTASGEAVIRGTEYLVRDDGAVTVLSGAVNVKYNNPHDQGPKKFTVEAGQSFDPATRSVVPTTPAFLQNIAYHIDTVRNGARFYQVSGHASVVVRPIKGVSPVVPGGEAPSQQ